jgi:hypothetical protein
MPKSRLALIAAVVIALVCVPFLFLARSPSAGITLSLLGTDPVADALGVTFAISNHTGRSYHVSTSRLETRVGNGWKECPDGIVGLSISEIQWPHSEGKLRCVIKPLPPGTPVRLVMRSMREEGGLSSFIWRVKVWRAGNASFSSLFDFKTKFLLERNELTTEEFPVP